MKMKKTILVVAVVAGLAVAGTAVAVAAQPSASYTPSDGLVDTHRSMYGPMNDGDGMPMFGGAEDEDWSQWHEEMDGWMSDGDGMRMFGGAEDEDWSQWHEEMDGRMSDHWDEMPMFGGPGSGEWSNAPGTEGGGTWCHRIVSGA